MKIIKQNYSDLLLSVPDGEVSYSMLLNCIEWEMKRIEIKKRDSNKCTKCGKRQTFKILNGGKTQYSSPEKLDSNKFTLGLTDMPINLEIHHEYYILGKLPWEYRDEALITVCRECHQEIHDNKKIDVWDENMLKKYEFGDCHRCSGLGYLKEYSHVNGGRCFSCGGMGYEIPKYPKV